MNSAVKYVVQRKGMAFLGATCSTDNASSLEKQSTFYFYYQRRAQSFMANNGSPKVRGSWGCSKRGSSITSACPVGG